MDVNKIRVNATMPKYMIDEVDKISDMLGATRSSTIAMIIKQYLDQQDMLKLTQMVEVFEKANSMQEKSKK